MNEVSINFSKDIHCNTIYIFILQCNFLLESLLSAFSIKAIQIFFLNKIKTVLNINAILYSCESTFDSITDPLAEVQTLNPIYDGYQALL